MRDCWPTGYPSAKWSVIVTSRTLIQASTGQAKLKWVHCLILLVLFWSCLTSHSWAAQDTKQQQADSLYADAANFQRGGAYEIAVQSWKSFLDRYPQDPKATNASYYLGICYLQQSVPNYAAASQAFEQTLKDPQFSMRGEAYTNLAWSLYRQGTAGPQPDTQLLQKTLAVLAKLLEEKPSVPLAGQALFYSGEASYALGNRKQAIDFYTRFLSSQPNTSPLRGDVLYGKGVAEEELEFNDAAITSYETLLETCERTEIVTDVKLRLGDLYILNGKFEEAINTFRFVVNSVDEPTDRSYALFREAFSLIQLNRYELASAKYSELLEQYPDSDLAGSAQFAKAQSYYRSGKMDLAEIEFTKSRDGDDLVIATEATHWIARIRLTRDRHAETIKVTRDQIKKGLEGNFTIPVQMDLAEALAFSKTIDPQSEAKEIFCRIYDQNPEHPLAPKALFNATVITFQLNEFSDALSLCERFLDALTTDPMRAEIGYIKAESARNLGQTNVANQSYLDLLNIECNDKHPMRGTWLLRAGAYWNTVGKSQQTLELLGREGDLFTEPAQQAEAFLLLGQAHLESDDALSAVKSLRASEEKNTGWQRLPEVRLTLGDALLAAELPVEAEECWLDLAENNPGSTYGDQARYRLANLYRDRSDFDEAISLYRSIYEGSQVAELKPHARYGAGWTFIQKKDYQAAIDTLDVLINEEDDQVYFDALTARGIAFRQINQHDKALRDLKLCLELASTNQRKANTLFELSLVYVQTNDTNAAVNALQTICDNHSDFAGMEDVLFELGWAYSKNSQPEKASGIFSRLLETYPKSKYSGEAAYFNGQQSYAAQNFDQAIRNFQLAISVSDDNALIERAMYRVAWSLYNKKEYLEADKEFSKQLRQYSETPLALDAMMMIGECRYQLKNYASALESYEIARDTILSNNDSATTIRDPSERQVREIVLLHGGQSAAQLGQWTEAIKWYDELRKRFPSTNYLAEVFYETGFAHQQQGNNDMALELLAEVANNYRNETGARSRFMMGEIYFSDQRMELAIPEFQRVMYGFGSENASDAIKNWQAKSGFEAGRCAEIILSKTGTPDSNQRAKQIARGFYQYVVDKHPNHNLVNKSLERLKALQVD